MNHNSQRINQNSGLSIPSYNLLCLRRAYDQRHQHDVNLALGSRPRERGEDLN